MKATANAPSNLAFIKYWGKADEDLRLPLNGSISMNLSGLTTATTVAFEQGLEHDDVTIDGGRDAKAASRVSAHLDRIRSMAGSDQRARVVSESNFPSGTGLSSSASGMAALTVAAASAAGLDLSERQLAVLARLGSGSACRSIPDGFVEWKSAESSADSYAASIAPADHWDIIDLVAVVTREEKRVATTGGMGGAKTSPFLERRLKDLPVTLDLVRRAIVEKDFDALVGLAERDALEMHAVMLTQRPPLVYWTPGTLAVMRLVPEWREQGVSCGFSMNTGQNVHVLCQPKDASVLFDLLADLPVVEEVIESRPAPGARIIDRHLF